MALSMDVDGLGTTPTYTESGSIQQIKLAYLLLLVFEVK